MTDQTSSFPPGFCIEHDKQVYWPLAAPAASLWVRHIMRFLLPAALAVALMTGAAPRQTKNT